MISSKTFVYVLLPTLIAIVVVGQVRIRFDQQPSACKTGGDIDMSVGLIPDRSTGQENGKDKIVLVRELNGGLRKVSLKVYGFLGDKQVQQNLGNMEIDCGKSRSFTYELDKKQASSFTVAFDYLPLIPEKLVEYVKLNDTKNLPSEIKNWLASEVIDRIRPYGIVFNKNTEQFKPNDYKQATAGFVKTNSTNAYLFTNNWKDQQYLLTTQKNRVDFGVFFSMQDDKNPNEVYTITCLVNGQQTSAFGGLRAWSGVIPKDQGVVLRGTLQLQKKGWYRLNCLNIANKFRLFGKDSYFTYGIDALLIYFK